MKELENSTYLVGYIISNIVGLLILWASIRKPYLGRLIFVLLFAWASVANYTTAHNSPEDYLNYAETSIKWYRDFIHGWFSRNITLVVTSIAICEALISIGMVLKGWWVRFACIGVIIFLLAIAPMGVYAAFPFSITVSLAAFFILKKNALSYLWKFNSRQAKNNLSKKVNYEIE